MSVRPVTFYPDGSIDVVYDEQGHTGTIPAAEIVWTTNMDGGDSHNFIVLHCPDGCGATSTHPVGGGAAPVEVQRLFVDKTTRDGCACGQVAAGRTDSVPESHVHLNCDRLDGPARWQLDTQPQAEPRAGQAPIFQVVYRQSDRLIVGLSPRGGVGPDHGLSVIHDLSQYDVLLATDPAYLGVDGQHILSSPPVGAST
jgi:hypothetical protein